jgi:hypothetical protein
LAKLIGRLPDPWAGVPPPVATGTGVDIAANIYDRFGPAATPGSAKLGIAKIRFSITGKDMGGSSGDIAGFDFSKIIDPKLTTYRYFADFNRTRSIYTNDTTSDSAMVGPYYYTVTNTTSTEAEFGDGGVFPDDAMSYYWNTLVGQNFDWNHRLLKNNATSNAKARFPDDVYDIKIEAFDLSGNSESKTVQVLLDNWKQAMRLPGGQDRLVPGADIVVSKGTQFLASQQLEFYCIPVAVGEETELANGTALSSSSSIGMIETDAEGQFHNAKFEGQAPGSPGEYWVVADYNGDGEFTERLDAAVRLTVIPRPDPGPVKAHGDSYSGSHGWPLMVGAPGVLSNDVMPAPVVLVTEPQFGEVSLNSDGSFIYYPVPGHYSDGFYYRLSSGTGIDYSAYVMIQLTKESPVGVMDVHSVVHGQSVQATVAESVLDNDTDWDEDALTAQFITQAQHGVFQGQSNGSFSYTPNQGFVGTDTVAYYVVDATGQFGPSTVKFNVTNEMPRSGQDYYETLPVQELVVTAAEGVRINDSDEDGDPITVALSYGPTHGTVQLNSNGSFTYDPNPGFIGYDHFFYIASDGFSSGELTEVVVYVTNGVLIGDEVFNDLNENGIQDDDEPGVPGLTVRMLDSLGNPASELLTDNEGRFVFDVLPGSYRLQVVVPSGASVSPQDEGDEEWDDSDIATTGLSDLFVFEYGDAVYDIDAGLFGASLPLPEVETGSVGDWVWNDWDGDGIQDEGEPGKAGVVVNLLDVDDNLLATTTTASDGSYNFADAPAGWLRIRVDIPAGWESTPQYAGAYSNADNDVDEIGETDLFYLSADETRADIDAGLSDGEGPPPPSILGGRLFVDTNDNDVLDSSETGMGGVVVYLLDAMGLIVASTTTASDGTYSFANVDPGEYRIQFEKPFGYVFVNANQGSDELADSDVTDPFAGTTELFTYSGGTNLTITAGIESEV